MKKTGIINSEVSAVVANMGHMDWLSIGDAGMPVPMGTKKIDLALDKQLPSFMDVLNNVLKEMKVQMNQPLIKLEPIPIIKAPVKVT